VNEEVTWTLLVGGMVNSYQFKAIHVTGRGGSLSCETRGFHIFHIIGSQVAVRLSALSAGRPLTPRKIPGTHFYYRLSRTEGHCAVGRTRSIENSSDLIGNLHRDLPASSAVPQPTTLPRPTLRFKIVSTSCTLSSSTFQSRIRKLQ
jgi:hypothetical protein